MIVNAVYFFPNSFSQDHLRNTRMFDSLCVIQLESGFSEKALDTEEHFLHRLCLEGNWDNAILYVDALNQYPERHAQVKTYFLSPLAFRQHHS